MCDGLTCLETDGESLHAAQGKYYVKSTVFDDRVLTHVFSVKGTAASYLQLLGLMNRMSLSAENIDMHHIDIETFQITVVLDIPHFLRHHIDETTINKGRD